VTGATRMMAVPTGRVLIVAGSDSGGGAGIQGDIKAVSALGGFAMTAITALTAQNSLGVEGVYPVPIDFIQKQMRMVAQDLGVDTLKTGMLATAEVIDGVAEVLDEMPDTPLIVDPVMVAKGGFKLLDPAAADSLVRSLVPRADVLTPNMPEAAVLIGREIAGPADMRDAAMRLLDLGPGSVLLKGGHIDGPEVIDLLVSRDSDLVEIRHPRIDTRHTHGTGCATASAIAAGLAQGLELEAAVRRAIDYVREAIRTAPGWGGGHGPLNHFHTLRPAD